MDGLTSVFVYQGVVRKLVGKLKYGLVSDLKDDLLELMASFGDFVVIASQKWLVTAVPLHVARARERGFNQAELLAYAISEYFGWPVENKILSRNTKTVKQMNLNKKERLANVRAAFEISEDMKKVVAGKRILLVDDVWTTGATLRENAKMLKRAGAKVVWGLAFAA
jgi:ComF family protein